MYSSTQVQGDGDDDRDRTSNQPCLVQEDRRITVEPVDIEGSGGERRAHRLWRGAEQDEAAVLQDQRDTQGDQKLTEVTVVHGAGGTQARNTGDQEPVQHRAANEHDRTGAKRADEWPDIGTEKREHAGAGDQVQAGVHAQHQQFALSEIDDAHDAEDQPEADAHQAINAANGDTGSERVQRVLDEDFEVHLACLPPFSSSWQALCRP